MFHLVQEQICWKPCELQKDCATLQLWVIQSGTHYAGEETLEPKRTMHLLCILCNPQSCCMVKHIHSVSSQALPKSNSSADNTTSALGGEPHLIAEEKASGGRVSRHVIDLIPALISLCGALSVADCTVAQSIAARHRLGSWRWGWWILRQMTLYNNNNNNNALREADSMRRSTH
jgi:hypothetical protein